MTLCPLSVQYLPKHLHLLCVDMPGHEGTTRTNAEDYSIQGQVRRIRQVGMLELALMLKLAQQSDIVCILYYLYSSLCVCFQVCRNYSAKQEAIPLGGHLNGRKCSRSVRSLLFL